MEEFDEALKSMFVEANRLATFDGVKWPFPKRRKCRPSNVSCLCCSFNSKREGRGERRGKEGGGRGENWREEGGELERRGRRIGEGGEKERK